MTVKVLIVHADGEDARAEILAEPLRSAGYEPVHQGCVLVGDSFTERVSHLLAANGPLVLCGTIKAAGTGLPYRLLNAKRAHQGRVQIFPVRMDADAYLAVLAQDARIADYAADPGRAIDDLLQGLKARWPLDAAARESQARFDLEARYRSLALESHDIVDLANLPEDDRHLATQELELRRLYVPLRLRLEVQAGDEPSDATLAKLEQRRGTHWGDSGDDPPADYHQPDVVTVGERLGAARRLVVLGDPGAGKSTLLRWLATAYLLRLQQDPDLGDLPDIQTLPDADWLPILIRCRDLPPGTETLDAMLDHSLRRSELPETECAPLRQLLRSKLERGEALLLVDGLDEIADPRARAGFAEQLTRIQRALHRAPVVVTSRIVGYREMGYRIRAGFEHLTVADLSKDDKDRFAERWSALTEHPERRVDAAAELIRDIHSTDRIERLTGNPMLLTTMALIKRKLGRLPQRRVDLFEKAVEVLLNWRSQVDAPIDPREALPQLEYLAHAMCSEGIQQVREDELLSWLTRCREEFPQIHPLREHSAEAFLALLERRTGLLIQAGLTRHDGRTLPVYEFRHLSLQEYLAAIALVQGHYRDRDRSKGLAEVVGPLAGRIGEQGSRAVVWRPDDVAVEESWREPLRLCLTACNDDEADAALRAILQPAPSETGTERPRAVMAALCLADEPNVEDDTAAQVLDGLVAVVGEPDGRGRVNSTLDAAAMALANSRWSAWLTERLLTAFMSAEPTARHSPGGLLAMIQGRDSSDAATIEADQLEGLAAGLRSGDDRQTAASALTVMALAFRRSDWHRSHLADALVDCLSGVAATSHAAAWALGWMSMGGAGHEPSSRWQPEPHHMQAIIDCLSTTSDPKVVRWLSGIVADWPDASAIEPLLKQLVAHPPATRSSIVKALAAIGGPQCLEVLRARFRDEDEGVRKVSLAGLATSECSDEIERRLLSQGFHLRLSVRFGGAIDPKETISVERVDQAASRLKLSRDEIRRRYERLAKQFGLKLAWTAGLSGPQHE